MPGARRPVERDLEAAEQRLARRQAAVPARIDFPEDLPVSERRDDIAAAIRDHQVVVIAGETGSGKTTQIPKICLELGRGVRGLIGHTQPAAAGRALGGRAHRRGARHPARQDRRLHRPLPRPGRRGHPRQAHDRRRAAAEITRDRDLLAYDTIIVDEAHERSLNIDFLLGYLKQLLAGGPTSS
jgi:ATP-dependent helicase HrpA